MVVVYMYDVTMFLKLSDWYISNLFIQILDHLSWNTIQHEIHYPLFSPTLTTRFYEPTANKMSD
jgi:hypothetical protein